VLAALYPQQDPGTHFCYRLGQTQGYNAAGRIRSTGKCNDLIGNLTRDLPACGIVPQPTTNKQQTPWPESTGELYRSSDCHLLAKLVPTFADIGCHVVSVTDPYGRILGFLGWSTYGAFKSFFSLLNYETNLSLVPHNRF
jgi:hypothetical protein